MGYKSVLHINTQKDSGTSNTDTVVITKPIGLQVDDFMLGFFLSALDGVTAPSGWTQLDSDSSNNMRSVVFYKFATASDVNATSFTFTADSDLGPFCGGISAYRYVNLTDPFNAQAQAIDNSGADPVTTPGVTTTHTSCTVHYLAVREQTTTIPTFSASGVTERADFGNHGNTISYAMAWYDTNAVTPIGSVSGISINPTGTVTQSIARTISLRTQLLNVSDTAGPVVENSGLAFVVNQTDGVTGTEQPISIGTSTASNVDAVTRNETQAITGTWDTPFPDAVTTTEISRVKLVDSDSASAILEKAVVNDQNHPSKSDASSLSNESAAITAYISSADVFVGRDYQTSPGGTPGTIGDYRTTLIQGPADIYVADFGAIEPVGIGVTNPPPSAYWTHVGGTLDGVTLSVEHEWDDLDMKNISDRAGRRLKKRRIKAEVALAEPSLDNMIYALDNGSVTNYAGYKVYLPPATVDRATPLTYKSVVIHGWAPGLRADGTQKRRMIIMRKCLAIDTTKMVYSKEDQTTIAITWAVHRVSNSTAPFVIIDET